MDDTKEKIINRSFEVYSRQGFRKTTMDEIAGDLGISKKTIYKYFPSKSELIEGVVDKIMNLLKSGVEESLENGADCVERLFKLSVFISNRISALDKKWLRDLQIHAPYLWAKVEKFRRKVIQKNFEKIIIDGQNSGLIIDAPLELLLTIIISTVTSVVNPEFLINNNISSKIAVNKTLEILFRGILTSKGMKNFNKYKSGKKK